MIAAEGEKTEPRYFALFSDASVIHVRCLNWRGDNSPDQVLSRMEQYLIAPAWQSTSRGIGQPCR